MKKVLSLLLCVWIVSFQAQNIEEIEVWVDMDPGFGEATAINSFPPTAELTDFIFTIDDPLSIGNHVIGVRSKDEHGVWSHTHISIVEVLENDPLPEVVQIEYFINDDPGFGMGLPLSNPLTPALEIQGLVDSLTTTISETGNHVIGMRAMDAYGKWSHTNFIPIQVLSEPVVEDVVAIEYFWIDENGSNDPNFDNASVVMDVPQNSNMENFVFEAELPVGANVGDELTLMVRATDASNKWSHTNKVNEVEVYNLNTETEFLDINECDQYVDPNGTIIVNDTTYNDIFFTGSEFQVTTLNVDITILNNTITEGINSLSANESGATYQWLDCDAGNAPIEGETSQVFTFQGSGEYAVEITSQGCVTTSECTEVTFVSVEDFAGNEQVLYSFYPNPANTLLNVSVTNNFDQNQLNILDLQGRIVISLDLNNGIQQLDISALSPATYLVQFINDKGQVTNRLSVK